MVYTKKTIYRGNCGESDVYTEETAHRGDPLQRRVHLKGLTHKRPTQRGRLRGKGVTHGVHYVYEGYKHEKEHIWRRRFIEGIETER